MAPMLYLFCATDGGRFGERGPGWHGQGTPCAVHRAEGGVLGGIAGLRCFDVRARSWIRGMEIFDNKRGRRTWGEREGGDMLLLLYWKQVLVGGRTKRGEAPTRCVGQTSRFVG